MLILQVATIPTPSRLTAPRVRLELESMPANQLRGLGISLTGSAGMPMPTASVCIADSITTPRGSFNLRIVLSADHDRVSVVIGPIDDGDILSLIGGPVEGDQVVPTHNYFTATFLHRNPARAAGCEIECEHGRKEQGECCVTCKQGTTTMKVCC